jgi:hypothetical protein
MTVGGGSYQPELLLATLINAAQHAQNTDESSAFCTERRHNAAAVVGRRGFAPLATAKSWRVCSLNPSQILSICSVPPTGLPLRSYFKVQPQACPIRSQMIDLDTGRTN